MRMRFQQAVTEFAQALRTGDPVKSPRTIEAYVGAVHRVIGTMNIPWDNAEAMRPALSAWREALVAAKRAQQCSDSKVRGEVSAIRSFYTFAHERGWVAENPAADIKGIARDRRLPRPMPPEDVQRLLAAIPVTLAAPEILWRTRAMIECFLNGMRNVEVCRLTVGSVRYDIGEQSLVLSVVGKGLHLRQIVLNPNSASFMAGYLLLRFTGRNWIDVVQQAEDKLSALFQLLDRAVLHTDNSHLPLFIHNGRALTRQVVNEVFRECRNLAELDTSYGPHSLRHTCGTEMLAHGIDLRVVQEQLGHLGIEQTVLYTKVLTSAKAHAARMLPTAGAAM